MFVRNTLVLEDILCSRGRLIRFEWPNAISFFAQRLELLIRYLNERVLVPSSQHSVYFLPFNVICRFPYARFECVQERIPAGAEEELQQYNIVQCVKVISNFILSF